MELLAMLLDLPSYTMCLVAFLVGLKLHVLLIRSQILQPLLAPYDLVTLTYDMA